jgi:hypothetical protein
MQKWEYKRIGGWGTELELNKLGAEGWELVAAAADCNETGAQEIFSISSAQFQIRTLLSVWRDFGQLPIACYFCNAFRRLTN